MTGNAGGLEGRPRSASRPAGRGTPDREVLVVGAGPAGSVAALVLARAGVKVRLIDRESFPRDKLCGDTLNPGTLAILDRLGVGRAIRVRARPFTGMLVTGPGGACVAADYPDAMVGGALRRRDLDSLLLDAAIAAGADFIPNVHVVGPATGSSDARVSGIRIRHRSHDEEFPARMVIAADGRHSKLGFALGLTRFAPRPKRWAFGTYFTDVDGLSARGEMHIGIDHYAGVAPLPDDVANVCVVRELKRTQRDDRLKAEQVIEDAIARNLALQPRFARARRVSPVASLGPLAVDATTAGCPGLLLAGDAAGFIDPMTGDGMRFALRGGELAAEAALEEFERSVPAHEHLRAARQREFSGKWRLDRTLRSLVASPRSLAVVEAIGSRWPSPVNLLVGVAGDVRLARG